MKCNKRKRSAFESRIVRFISSRSFDSTRLELRLSRVSSTICAPRIANTESSLFFKEGKKKKKNSFYARERVVPQKEDREADKHFLS